MAVYRVPGRIGGMCLIPLRHSKLPRISLGHAPFGKIDIALQLRIEKFYKDVEYHGSPSDEDIIIVASLVERIIGLIRIAEEHSMESTQQALILRGMMVHELFRNRGTGSRMLGYMVGLLEGLYSGRPCFCVVPNTPEHLRFYERAEFRLIESHEAPTFLQARAEEYRETFGRPFSILRRP
jgi:GNAT superfamily N-acetyltransferase